MAYDCAMTSGEPGNKLHDSAPLLPYTPPWGTTSQCARNDPEFETQHGANHLTGIRQSAMHDIAWISGNMQKGVP